MAGGFAEGSDCIFVTSQPWGNPGGLFDGNISEHRLCEFLCRLSVLIHSVQTEPRQDVLIKKGRDIRGSIIRDF